METFRRKNEILFAAVFAAAYVICAVAGNLLSPLLGIRQCLTAVLFLIPTLVLLLFVRKEKLGEYYGLCAPKLAAGVFLYFIPLIVLISVPLWFGIRPELSAVDAVFFVIAALLGGFLEELIFRGILFNALRKKSVKSAMLAAVGAMALSPVLALTDGTAADSGTVVCRVIAAMFLGFLFVILFFKGKSLIPCMAAHGAMSALSVLTAAETAARYQAPATAVFSVLCIVYALIIVKGASSVKE